MAVSDEYTAWIEELFAAFGPVRVKRMFGGAGIFHDDVMIGLVAQGSIYLRTDPQSAADFAAEGSAPFVYSGGGRTVEMPYWRLPERLLDEPEELAGWARRAQASAVAAKAAKGTRGRRRGSGDG